MSAEASYLTERLAERRKRVGSGVAGIVLLLALGLGLLLSHPMPEPSPTATAQSAGQQLASSQAEAVSLATAH